jgi:hypothetical protein
VKSLSQSHQLLTNMSEFMIASPVPSGHAEGEMHLMVKINDAGESLEETLAKVDLKSLNESAPYEEASLIETASVTIDTASLATLESRQVPASPIAPVEFPKEWKDALRSIMTPIHNFVKYEKINGMRYIPIVEARGGSDKDPASGHRRDSIPIATQIAEQEDCASAIFHFLEDSISAEASDTNAILRRHLLRTATGVIVRVNPGTLTPVAQANLEVMLTELSSAGIQIMTTPQVQRQMGAKDSLVKIRGLRCGLPDTAAFYDAPSFTEGFLKSIAFRPRVVKQNRGSQGEGIWICKLKDESKYCKNYGDAIASLDTELVLMEANDNHVEYHTVGEFLEFCVNGRTEKSGVWESTGEGRYLEGGVDSGAMLVDQRFLPRIVEGEVRLNMIGSELVNLVHKIPKEGGLSCTLQSGAVYTSYETEDPKFAALVKAFRADLPKIMDSFGMAGEPLPLLWTADFIFDTDDQGKDIFYIGEFNCSCVGITQDLYLSEVVAKTAIATCAK